MVNYAENEFYRQAMKSGAGQRASGVRLPKMPQLQVWPHNGASLLLFTTKTLRFLHNINLFLPPWRYAR